VYRPKWRIALEQLDRAAANGVRFEWLTFDEGYGGKPEFLQELTARGHAWVAEVPKDTAGWLVEPRVTERPYRTHPRGRPRSKRRLVSGQPRPRRADELLARHPLLKDAPWTPFRLDDRDQGPSVWEVKHVRFWPTAEGGLPGEPCHLLLARHVLQGEDVKYFRSNAPEGATTETLLRVALTRHRVERCFQDQKTELGLDHYEGRTYTGLIRHLYVTLVSYLFAMRAVESRRGEKSGVDSAAGASRGRRPIAGEDVAGLRVAVPVGETGRRDRVPPNPQPPSTAVPRQTHAATVERTRHTTHQGVTMPSVGLAL
jgi:SRSO17 transposase